MYNLNCQTNIYQKRGFPLAVIYFLAERARAPCAHLARPHYTMSFRLYLRKL